MVPNGIDAVVYLELFSHLEKGSERRIEQLSLSSMPRKGGN